MARAAFVLALIAVLTSPATAHDIDVATFELAPIAAKAAGQTAQGWVLDVHVAQAALGAALGDGPVDKAYKERAVAYLKQHVTLTLADQPLPLGAGGIRLGGHQSDLRLIVRDLLAAGAALRVRIDAFAEDGHQSNVLKVRGATPATVVLHEANGFTATIHPTR